MLSFLSRDKPVPLFMPFYRSVIIGILLPLQSYMDSEIRAIMAQYMPLDSQAEVPNYVNENRA